MTTDIDKAAQEAWRKFKHPELISLCDFSFGFRAGAEWREGQQQCPHIRTSDEGSSWCALAEKGRVPDDILQFACPVNNRILVKDCKKSAELKKNKGRLLVETCTFCDWLADALTPESNG